MNMSPIEWLQGGFTWNPITGCPWPKVSPGCANCYAERVMNTRLRHVYASRAEYSSLEGEPFQAVWHHPERLLQPLQRQKPSRIFVCSMGDLFHDLVDDEWLAGVFTVMALCPQHTFLLLTKRPERMRSWILDEQASAGAMLFNALHDICVRAGLDPDKANAGISWPLPNVWIGVTVCNQEEANRKIPVLLQTPAAKRFVSVEPMLGPVDVRLAYPQDYMHCTLCGWHGYNDELVRKPAGIYEEEYCPVCQNDGTFALDYPHEDSELALGGLDWVICGGETGKNARPINPDWVRSLRNQCKSSRCQPTPFFFKSWGEYVTIEGIGDNGSWSDIPLRLRSSGIDVKHLLKKNGSLKNGTKGWYDIFPGSRLTGQACPVGKRLSGRLLDGEEWNEVPEVRHAT